MQHTLVAVFELRSEAEHAMDELLAGGFSRSEVQISKADATGQTDSLTGRPTSADEQPHDEGFGAGIRHFFKDIFGTDSSVHTQKYSDAVARGHHVLIVNAADEPEIERAADIVERHGPVDIDEKVAQWGGGAPVAQPESMRMGGAGAMQQSAAASAQTASLMERHGEPSLFQQQSLQDEAPRGTTYQEPMGDSGNLSLGSSGGALQGAASQQGSQQGSQQRDSGSGATTSIPVIEERLTVGKREVQRGGLRVYSHVVETPVHEQIGLREEHVNVERHKVDQPISSDDPAAFSDQRIELRESAEEPVVGKSARVVEEVVVGKQVSQRQQEISDTLRHTEVRIESLVAEADEPAFRQHWQGKYGASGGSYDEYAPAYGYGSEVARSDKYRGRQWNDIEPELRSDWEGRNTGASAWEKVKDAVRNAWEKISGADDDSAYRSHWSSHYAHGGGIYDDYWPAYSYGSDMARSDKYRGRDWDQVEGDLRSDWETRHGGAGSTWEQFKAAIRHGWERITR
jgi:uncharacterized protein (TIGR02271 family)